MVACASRRPEPYGPESHAGDRAASSVALPDDGLPVPGAELAVQVRELQARLHEKDEELKAALKELDALRASNSGRGVDGNDAAQAAAVRSLQEELAAERARREALVRELEELRRDVASPYGENRVPESEYLAIKQELVDLRRRLQTLEEDRRSLMAADRSMSAGAGEQERALSREQERLAADVAGELDATRARVLQLEQQLSESRALLQRSESIAQENSALREQLAEEKRRAEALEAKLKVAARVTELIFRMRSEAGRGVAPENGR